MEKTKYKLLLVPSSEDERLYEDFKTFEEAFLFHLDREDTVQTFTFDTEKERSAFLEGVAAMEGYQGTGLSFTTEETVVVEGTTLIEKIRQELKGINVLDMTTAEKKIWDLLVTFSTT